ncbi:MAG TPA: DegT/DnrJ/EryC1/StrS family aminotransferase [Spirochaetia bacterium]
MQESLALYGGEKTALEPFPPWPRYSEKAIVEAMQPLRDGRAGVTAELEARWAEWVGAPYGVSCSSGTAALHLALLALGVGPGDEVIVPSHTFISTVLAVIHCGAIPVFCDVTDDQTIDPRLLPTHASPRTRAILVVHLYGIVCDMDRILSAAREIGCPVVEDCAQATGAEHRGRKTGSLGAAGCFSFSQTKHVSTGGEGGMVVTADPKVARACRCLRDYGRDSDPGANGAIALPGYNYRLTDVQAAIGCVEMARLDTWNLPRRRGYARVYDHALSQLYGVRGIPLCTQERLNAYWKYPVQLDESKLTCGADEVRRALAAEGIPDMGAPPPEAYDEPLFAARDGARCPNAEALLRRTILLGLPPTWEKTHVELCAAALRKVLRAYKR